MGRVPQQAPSGEGIPTQEQLRLAANGKDAPHGGLNKPEMIAYLKEQGLPTSGHCDVLRKRLKDHLGSADRRSTIVVLSSDFVDVLQIARVRLTRGSCVSAPQGWHDSAATLFPSSE